MICPRCGNEWDATNGACARCGFVVRTVGQSGSFPNLPNSPQRNGQQSGGLSNPSPQSGGMSSVNQQSGGLTVPVQPGFPATGLPAPMTPIPTQGSKNGFTNSASTFEGAFPKPSFEKNVLRGVPQGTQQTGMRSTDSLSYNNNAQGQASSSTYPANRSMGYPQQDMLSPQTSVQPQYPMRQYPTESSNRNTNTSNQHIPRSANSFQQAPNALSPIRSNVMTSSIRPLLPGVLLRGGRYRLQEIRERQDWLPGIFEAVWIGKDAHRAGSQVMICEVVLPENTSIGTLTILRNATMTLATVGRHPHIPALWDAFSDQGRSFFVFEPIEGETLRARMRYSGGALPEQEVVECCLQLTDVLELLTQQSSRLVHGLIRPEHIVLSRNSSQYILTNFSVVLAGGATQYIAGLERSRLSSYAAPEFVRGVVDSRTDIYSLVATAYHAVTGSAPSGISGSIPPAQRINPNISSAFEAILSKGLRTVPNQRYQRPSELRQDLLAIRSVNGTLVSSSSNNPAMRNNNASLIYQNAKQSDVSTRNASDQVAQALPLLLNANDDIEDEVILLPKPEDLPPMKAGNDSMNAVILMGLILVTLVVFVILSQMLT